MKTYIIILLLIIAALCIAFSLFSYYVSRQIIEIDNTAEKQRKRQTYHVHSPADFDLNSEAIHFSTKDGLQLAGLIIRTDLAVAKGSIILVHGITSHKEHYFPICKYLAEQGYNSIVFDLRAHGSSEGDYCTYGFMERQDVSVLLDTLTAKHNLSPNFGIWGHSLGAAIAMESLAMDKRLKYGIIESAFSDSRTIIHDYIRRSLGFYTPRLINFFIKVAERKAHFRVDEIVPSHSAKQIEQAVLVVHGEKDCHVKFEYGRQNFDNIASKDKEFVSIKEANHINIWKIGGKDYFTKVTEFLNRMALD